MNAGVRIAERRRRDVAGPLAFGLPAEAAVPGVVGLHPAAGEGGRCEERLQQPRRSGGAWSARRAQPLNDG